MNLLIAAPLILAIGLGPEPSNPVYEVVTRDGLSTGGVTVRLPEPSFPARADAAEQRRVLQALLGPGRGIDDFLRDSVTAPFVLKLRDVKGEGVTIRVLDLWFVVRGDLDAVDPARVTGEADGVEAEAGNMRFRSHVVAEPGDDAAHRHVHLAGRLLDRIAVGSTQEVQVTRAPGVLVAASRTDPKYDAPGPNANRWRAVGRDGDGPEQPYAGGIGYARITALEEPVGALLVEVHGAFSEPDGWFRGAPILRSKLAPIAQDRIRQLRRELARRSAGAVPAPR